MRSQKINQWLALLANFGVILGLILVAYELQQNSSLMRIQISQARADAAMVSNEQLFNSNYIPGILQRIEKGQELSDEDWMRYVSWYRASNRNQDNVLSQYQAGMLGDNIPRSLSDFVRDVIAPTKYAKAAWDKTKVGYTDDYVEFVETLLRDTAHE